MHLRRRRSIIFVLPRKSFIAMERALARTAFHPANYRLNRSTFARDVCSNLRPTKTAVSR